MNKFEQLDKQSQKIRLLNLYAIRLELDLDKGHLEAIESTIDEFEAIYFNNE